MKRAKREGGGVGDTESGGRTGGEVSARCSTISVCSRESASGLRAIFEPSRGLSCTLIVLRWRTRRDWV